MISYVNNNFLLNQIMDSEDKRNEQFVRLEMRLHDIVFCSFNPLKVSPTYIGYRYLTHT
jgi:hypothetical protein